MTSAISCWGHESEYIDIMRSDGRDEILLKLPSGDKQSISKYLIDC